MAGMNNIFSGLKEMIVGPKAEDVYRRQLQAYKNQLHILKESRDTYHELRHDLKFHMALLTDYIEKNENEKALKYMESISGCMGRGQCYVNSGNLCVDSILNYGLRKIYEIGGSVTTDIQIGEELTVDDFDMNIVLGNLLANACEAMEKNHRKALDITMRSYKGVLKIVTVNSYDGTVKEKGGQLLSAKPESEGHGIGLLSVKRVVQKYHGELATSYTQDSFRTTVLLYL